MKKVLSAGPESHLAANMDKYDIVKGNELIQALHKKQSLTQARIIMAALMQIRSVEELDSKKVFTVHTRDIQELVGLTQTKGGIYTQLRTAALALSEVSVHF